MDADTRDKSIFSRHLYCLTKSNKTQKQTHHTNKTPERGGRPPTQFVLRCTSEKCVPNESKPNWKLQADRPIDQEAAGLHCSFRDQRGARRRQWRPGRSRCARRSPRRPRRRRCQAAPGRRTEPPSPPPTARSSQGW